jgi:glycosyltransferase involved in cell wall biosynthesis
VKVLVLTRYEHDGASSRQRFYQYLPILKAAGVRCVVRPLWDAAYVSSYYRGQRPAASHIALHYARRLLALRDIRDVDVIWLEGELWPFLPAFGERLLRIARKPLVVDYDDAVFHKYEHGNRRFLLAGKIDSVMRHASVVVAGNSYLADRANRSGACKVEVVPTVVDMSRYPVLPGRRDGTLRIAWIVPQHTAPSLPIAAAGLRLAARSTPLTLAVIGANVSMPGVDVEHLSWSEASEAASIAGCDIGIMPLPDQPWERGKCGYKLIQYMACARPVAASPVGVNIEIVDGSVGILANDAAAWRDAILLLAGDPDLRARLGEAARRRVEERYSLAVAAPRIVSILRDAAALNPKTT